jgi:trimeric autotransporter adhesin
MKRSLCLFILTLNISIIFGQAPGIFNYQGVARNSVGNVLQNKNIALRLSIHDGTAGGPVVYSETRSVTTNPFGLFNVQVGSPGASGVTGSIAV